MIKYLVGTKKEFFNFVNSISTKDKIGILTHNDLDGIASAIFLQKILKAKNLKVDFIEFLKYGEDMFEDALKTKNVDKLFVSDLNMDEFRKDLETAKKTCDVFLIDHHLYSDDMEKKNIIKTGTSDCCAFVTYDLAKEFLNVKELNWLVCAAMISDKSYKNKENLEFIQSIYPKVQEKNIYDSVPGEIAKKITSACIFYADDLDKVYEIILKKDINKFEEIHKKINEAIENFIEEYKENAEFYPEKNLYFYLVRENLKGKMGSVISTLLSEGEKDKTFIFGSYEGEDKIKISARNQSGNVNVKDLMKKGIEGLRAGVAGGHEKASGANILKKDLEKFKKNLLK